MIKVSYLISYDYCMLLTSVKLLYKYVDKIIIAVDKNFKTWSGNTFEIPESFFKEVSNYDTRNIIEFYFDTFFIPSLSSTECESRERNMVLRKLGRGWKIQLDVDEYVYDFYKIKKYLNRYWYLTIFPKYTPLCIHGNLITLYKELPNGFLFIDNNESFPFITNQNSNTNRRRNDKIRNYNAQIKVIHQSWARPEKEIIMKIKNWGHNNDFDTDKYYIFWKNLNIDNYKNYINIHPIVPDIWNQLNFIPAISIDHFINKFASQNNQALTSLPEIKIIKSTIKKIIRRE